jgi:hypothetical protein
VGGMCGSEWGVDRMGRGLREDVCKHDGWGPREVMGAKRRRT